MTELLKQAIAQVEKLPSNEQDAIAARIIAEIEADHQWNRVLANSSDKTVRMAREALAEYAAGTTEELDPDRL